MSIISCLRVWSRMVLMMRCRTTVAVAKDLGISQATAARKIAKYVGGRKE